jgi:hypothetical protein
MIGMSAWAFTRRHAYLMFSLVVCLLWASDTVYRDYQHLTQKELFVYNSQGNTIIQLINGKQDMVWYRSRNESSQVASLTFNAHLAMHLNHTIFQPLDSASLQTPENPMSDNFIRFAGKRILVFDRLHLPNRMIKPADADIVILTQNIRTEIDDVIRLCSPEIIVADASNAPEKTALWEKQCSRAGIRYHSTTHQGAFAMSCP